MAFHFPEAPNTLTSDVVDEITGCPEYKLTAVTLHPTTALQPTPAYHDAQHPGS